jgi:hypothetical protein
LARGIITKMLKIICTKYTCELKADLVITDADIYNIFNGREFDGVQFKAYAIDEFIDKIIEIANNGKTVVLHTFNPLILNFVPDEIAIDCIFYSKDGELEKLFSHDFVKEKLAFMEVGEAILDTELHLL